MATLRSDLIIPEVFTPYFDRRDNFKEMPFFKVGVVQPLAELNLSAERGGDFVKIPFYKANLSGDFEVLSDSTSLTPAKITAQTTRLLLFFIEVVLSVPETWLLLAVGGGPDPMAAIAQKMAAYVNNQKQKDLFSCLTGAFGSINANSSSSALFDLTIDSESGDSPNNIESKTRCKGSGFVR